MVLNKLVLVLLFSAVTTICYTQPKITGFSPDIGPIGTSVTITGSGFSTIASENIVYFGATRATVKTAAASLLTVAVPAGATYQPITVLVDGLIAFSRKSFVVTFNGNGGFDSNSFAQRQDFSTNITSNRVCSGDLDGDGLSDLVISTSNNGSNEVVSILKNTSTLSTVSFAPKKGFGSFFRSSAAIGDLNGDGKLDLVLTDSLNGGLSIYENNSSIGNINFSSKSTDITSNQHPIVALIADLDNDGRSDIACGNSESISIFMNTSGSGGISFAPEISVGTGINLYNSIAFDDLDGDNMVDLVVTSYFNGSISIFKNTSSKGSISFAPKLDLASVPAFYAMYVSTADIDSDGKGDLVVSSLQHLSVFKNLSSLNKLEFSRTDFREFPNKFALSIGDLDGDGKIDLVTNQFNEPEIIVLKNVTNLNSIGFSSETKYSLAAGFAYSIAIVDLNNDGKQDIAVPDFSGAISILQNKIKSTQSISFAPLPEKALGDVPFGLFANSSSGLLISYSATPADRVVINGNQVQLLNAGLVTITASQAGDSNFAAATPVNRSFCINPHKPTITTEVISASSKLTSSSSNGNQWFLNGDPILGATSSTYFANQSGRYQVKVTTDQCSSELSEETIFVITGDISNNNLSTQLYPNPVNKSVMIIFEDHDQIKEISIYQSTGKLLECLQVLGKEIQVNLEHYPEGVYIARVVLSGGDTKVIRFVKQ